jgi:uncharacterized protein
MRGYLLINISALKNFSRVKKYVRSTIIAKDSIGTEMVVILKGEVGVFINYHKHNEEMIATIGPGDFFGETALFLEKSTPSTAVALTDVIALPINRITAVSFIRDEPEMAFELMKVMCARLDNVSTAYEKLNRHPWVDTKYLSKEPPPVQAAKTQESSPVSPAPSPVAAAQDPSQSLGFSLFPEGHGSYQLPLSNEDRAYLMDKSYTCPICKKEFKALQIRTSRLIMESTDRDMRHRYKGIEPLYYDVVTCPDCLYSALAEMFRCPVNPKAELRELQAFKSEAKFMFGTRIDTCTVFAGYYLALLCAPKCFGMHHLATAKLLLKLSRIYHDCGDKQMEEKTAKRALDAYTYFYINEETDPSQDQQLCIIIGELSLKLNDLKNARDYFFKVKNNRDGTPLLKNQAENRILDIRYIEVRA